MNSLMQEKWPVIEGSHGMRTTLLDALLDADLKFSPGGNNMTLGALCREFGEIEYSYIQSLKNFKLDFAYRNTDSGLESSVDRLKGWFQSLDTEMKTVIEAMSDDEAKKEIERNGSYKVSVPLQLDIYLQALLIFFGKATIFLRAMNKPLPQVYQDWIG